MSDVGLYKALEDELRGFVETLPDIATVTATLSAEALISLDGVRKPCIGIGDAALEAIRSLGVSGRQVEAKATYLVWTVFESARTEEGNAEARALARPSVERLRDAVHGTVSAVNARARWTWEGDAFLPVDNDLFTVYESRFSLAVHVGK